MLRKLLNSGPGLHFPSWCALGLGLGLVWATSPFEKEPGPAPQSQVPMSIHAEHCLGGEGGSPATLTLWCHGSVLRTYWVHGPVLGTGEWRGGGWE